VRDHARWVRALRLPFGQADKCKRSLGQAAAFATRLPIRHNVGKGTSDWNKPIQAKPIHNGCKPARHQKLGAAAIIAAILAHLVWAGSALASASAVNNDEDHQRRVDAFAQRLASYQALERSYRQRVAPTRQRPHFNSSPIRPGSSDLECLTQAIYYEARGEPIEGQIAVAQVVLNRARQPARPKSICQVVFEGAPRPGCQFSFACEGDRQAGPVRPLIWQQTQALAGSVLAGQFQGNTAATHYHADYVQPRWASQMQRLGQIGRHIFFASNP
jgi:spore germination cell wall hydrolase CwlJ-like protein